MEAEKANKKEAENNNANEEEHKPSKRPPCKKIFSNQKHNLFILNIYF